MKYLLSFILIFSFPDVFAATNSMKIRASNQAGITQVKILVTHVMETGVRIDKQTGETIPAKYITEIKAVWNNKVVFQGLPSIAVSKNPYFAFKFKGGIAGEEITVNWVDSSGDTDTKTAVIN